MFSGYWWRVHTVHSSTSVLPVYYLHHLRVVFSPSPAGTPQNINLLSVRKSLLSVHGVVTVYGLHTWSLNMNKSLVSVHVVTGEVKANAAFLATGSVLTCGYRRWNCFFDLRRDLIAKFSHTLSYCLSSTRRCWPVCCTNTSIPTDKLCPCFRSQKKLRIHTLSSRGRQISCAPSLVFPASPSRWSTAVQQLMESEPWLWSRTKGKLRKWRQKKKKTTKSTKDSYLCVYMRYL